MLSESARMSSAAEARFRVQAPNSTPRASTVIALDAAGDAVVRRLAGGGWEHATFLTVARGVRLPPSRASNEETRFGETHRRLDGSRQPDLRDGPAKAGPHVQAVLRDLSGRLRDLGEEIDAADLVILVAGPGGQAHAASLIGEACSRQRVMTTGFIVGVASASESALSKTLAQVRPWSLMVVIANGDDYIDDMLTALRA